jgi:hypothetical protein
MLEGLPPLPFAGVLRLCGALLASDIRVVPVHSQCHNVCRFKKLSHLTRDNQKIKTVHVAVGKTEASRQSNTEIKERLAVAIQVHAADFDAGLAALQAAICS